MLTAAHVEWIQGRGLDPELLDRYGVTGCDRRPGDWLAIPYWKDGVVVNHKYRQIEPKAFAQDTGAVKCFWNYAAIADESLKSEPLIVTEGEFDGLAALQSGFARTVSVPDGAPAEAQGDDDSGAKYSYVRDAAADLRDVREIILCVDGDPQGQNLLTDLAVRLGKHRCKSVRYPQHCKDLNDALKRYGVKGVQETIKRAQWMRVDGVYRMDELPLITEQRVYSICKPGFQNHYNIRLGDFCVITGIPSHGKSALVNDVAGEMVMRYGWNIAFASFEQKPQTDHRRNLRQWYNRKPVRHQAIEETEAADRWINKHFVFIVPNEDNDADLVWCLERCAAAVTQYDANMVVIDPWNEMDHIRPPDMTITEYTGFAIKQFRKFAAKYNVHVIVVAHPTKQKKSEDGTYQIPSLYDISDSQHWYNKADLGIVVHRKDETASVIRIAKSRYHDAIGKPGDIPVRFDTYQQRFECTDTSGSREVGAA